MRVQEQPNEFDDELRITIIGAGDIGSNLVSHAAKPSHTAECWLGSFQNPHVAIMTLEQFLEHLAERNGVTVWASAPEVYPIQHPLQLTDAVWETIDTVHIGCAFVGHDASFVVDSRKEEST
jgi:hypothetical protein